MSNILHSLWPYPSTKSVFSGKSHEKKSFKIRLYIEYSRETLEIFIGTL